MTAVYRLSVTQAEKDAITRILGELRRRGPDPDDPQGPEHPDLDCDTDPGADLHPADHDRGALLGLLGQLLGGPCRGRSPDLCRPAGLQPQTRPRRRRRRLRIMVNDNTTQHRPGEPTVSNAPTSTSRYVWWEALVGFVLGGTLAIVSVLADTGQVYDEAGDTTVEQSSFTAGLAIGAFLIALVAAAIGALIGLLIGLLRRRRYKAQEMMVAQYDGPSLRKEL